MASLSVGSGSRRGGPGRGGGGGGPMRPPHLSSGGLGSSIEKSKSAAAASRRRQSLAAGVGGVGLVGPPGRASYAVAKPQPTVRKQSLGTKRQDSLLPVPGGASSTSFGRQFSVDSGNSYNAEETSLSCKRSSIGSNQLKKPEPKLLNNDANSFHTSSSKNLRVDFNSKDGGAFVSTATTASTSAGSPSSKRRFCRSECNSFMAYFILGMLGFVVFWALLMLRIYLPESYWQWSYI